jgi:hypothetical protein
MKFSVLLPMRNRLDLLRSVVESVRRQDNADWVKQILTSDRRGGLKALRSFVPRLGVHELLLFGIWLALLHLILRLMSATTGVRHVEEHVAHASPFPRFEPNIREGEYRTILELVDAWPR